MMVAEAGKKSRKTQIMVEIDKNDEKQSGKQTNIKAGKKLWLNW